MLWFDDYCMSVAGSRWSSTSVPYDADFDPGLGRTVRRQSGGVVPRHPVRDRRAPTTDKPDGIVVQRRAAHGGRRPAHLDRHPGQQPATGVVWLGGTGQSRIANVTNADGATLVAGTNPHIRTP